MPEALNDKDRFAPKEDGAIMVNSECGEVITAYPGTFLYRILQNAQEISKEDENGREKTGSD